MSTTTYNLSDFPVFLNLLRDADDGKRDTHDADSCHGLLIGLNDVPSSDSDPRCRSSDSNFSFCFNECDVDEPHISVFQYNDDLKASADQTYSTDYENHVVGGPIENDSSRSINNHFWRRSDPAVNQPIMARRSSGRINNLAQRCTTAWFRDQLQRLRANREEFHERRDNNQWRAKLWRLTALAAGPLLLATMWKRRLLPSLGFCCTCPDCAASAASHATRMQFLPRYTHGAVALGQQIGSFSYTTPRWLYVISAVAAIIVLFAWKWSRPNTSRDTSRTFRNMPHRTSERWLTRRPTTTAGHHDNRTDVLRSEIEIDVLIDGIVDIKVQKRRMDQGEEEEDLC